MLENRIVYAWCDESIKWINKINKFTDQEAIEKSEQCLYICRCVRVYNGVCLYIGVYLYMYVDVCLYSSLVGVRVPVAYAYGESEQVCAWGVSIWVCEKW